MAGGMGGARSGWAKRGSGIPLAERVRLRDGERVPDPEEGECPARHCWVGGAVDDSGLKRPGLLVEWRQVANRWEGRVLYAAALRRSDAATTAPRGWVMVEEWLPAEVLTPY